MDLTLKDLTPEQVIEIAKYVKTQGDVSEPQTVAPAPVEPEVVAPAPVEPEVVAPAPEPTQEEVLEATSKIPMVTHEELTAKEGLDAAGIPWDERIHSSGRGKTARGVWKKRKNVPAYVYDQVMLELKGGTAPTAPAPAPEPTAPAPEPTAAEVFAAPAPAPDNVVSITPTLSLPEVMMRVTSGQVDQTLVMNTLSKHGLKSIAMLGARLDLLPVIVKELGL